MNESIAGRIHFGRSGQPTLAPTREPLLPRQPASYSMRASERLRLVLQPLVRLFDPPAPAASPAAPEPRLTRGYSRIHHAADPVPAGAAAVTVDPDAPPTSAAESGTSLLSFARDLWCIFAAAHVHDLRRVGLWMASNTAVAILGASLYGLVLPALQGETFALLTAAGTADGHADLAALRVNLAKLLGWICFLVSIEVAASASQIYLGLRWRRRLTARLQSDYLSRRAFYHLARRAPSLDNPDQRITSDLDQCLRTICGDYTTAGRGIVLSLSTSIALALAATASCVQAAGVKTTLAMCAYVALVLGLNVWINAAVPPWVRRVERAEGDFRYAHVRLRSHAESVAFFDGGAVESRVLSSRLDAAIAAATGLYWRTTRQSLLRSFCASTDSFVILTVVALPLFTGAKAAWSVSAITTVTNAVGLMLAGYGGIVSLITPTAKVAGLARRVAELQREMAQGAGEDAGGTMPEPDGKRAPGTRGPHRTSGAHVWGGSGGGAGGGGARVENGAGLGDGSSGGAKVEANGRSNGRSNGGSSGGGALIEFRSDTLAAHNLRYSTPSPGAIPLADGVSFSVGPGQALLVSGPSGAGKSSLLRCIAGLWDADSGTILRPEHVGRGGLFFLPQKPYLPLGSLRQCVIYPRACGPAAQSPFATGAEAPVVSGGGETANHVVARAAAEDDTRVLALLSSLGLDRLVDRFGLDSISSDSRPWDEVLSVGEQQRIGFARLLFHAPAFAVLDEATSALDEEAEAGCMRMARQAGLGIVSVAHRPSLARYHTHRLALSGQGLSQLVRL